MPERVTDAELGAIFRRAILGGDGYIDYAPDQPNRLIIDGYFNITAEERALLDRLDEEGVTRA